MEKPNPGRVGIDPNDHEPSSRNSDGVSTERVLPVVRKRVELGVGRVADPFGDDVHVERVSDRRKFSVG